MIDKELKSLSDCASECLTAVERLLEMSREDGDMWVLDDYEVMEQLNSIKENSEEIISDVRAHRENE